MTLLEVQGGKLLSEAPRTAPARILVVDDDEALAEMLHIVLESEGYDARLCHNGDTALAAFHDYRPDLVPAGLDAARP